MIDFGLACREMLSRKRWFRGRMIIWTANRYEFHSNPFSVLVLSYLKDLSSQKDGKKKWNFTIAIGLGVLLLNGYIEIAKHQADAKHEQVQKREGDQRQQELRTDIQLLNESAKAAFDKLQRSISSLPVDSAQALKSEAATIQSQLDQLTESVLSGRADSASVSRIQTSVDGIQQSVNKLSTQVDRFKLRDLPSSRYDPSTRTNSLAASQGVYAATRTETPSREVSNTSSSIQNPAPVSPPGFIPQPTNMSYNAGRFVLPGREPEVRITQVPPSGPGGPDISEEIAGRASGVDIREYRVVIYARTNVWYVQPSSAEPFTQIDRKGTWSNRSHLGREYAAILVRASAKLPVMVDVLPRPEHEIVAVDTMPGRER